MTPGLGVKPCPLTPLPWASPGKPGEEMMAPLWEAEDPRAVLSWFGFVGSGAPLSFQALQGNAAGYWPPSVHQPSQPSHPPGTASPSQLHY